MTTHYVFDVESLGTRENSVILSWALVSFQPDEDFTYDSLIENAYFDKLDVKDQFRAGREKDDSTIEWWRKQTKEARKMSLIPDPERDLPMLDAYHNMVNYLKKTGHRRNSIIWTRGSMDWTLLEHMCAINLNVLTPWLYNQVRDVRTAVDLLTGSSNGYCTVLPEAGVPDNVPKHDPVVDCAFDACMLVYPDPKNNIEDDIPF